MLLCKSQTTDQIIADNNDGRNGTIRKGPQRRKKAARVLFTRGGLLLLVLFAIFLRPFCNLAAAAALLAYFLRKCKLRLDECSGCKNTLCFVRFYILSK